MITQFTAEHDALRASVRGFLTARNTDAEIKRLADTESGFNPHTWQELAQLGVPGLLIDEEFGGSGASFVELAIVLEEAGAALLPAPLLSTALLSALLLSEAADSEAKADYLPRIATGDLTAAVCLSDATGRVTAAPSGGAWALTGTSSYVIDGASAGLLLVVAAAPDGACVFAVDGDTQGVERTALVTLDLARKQARIGFGEAPARLIADAATTARILPRLHDLAATGLAVEQVGGMQRLLDMAVGYAQQRVQFGRAIGSFQAVKHRCADMLIRLELARSAAYHAVWAAVNAPEELPSAAALAKSYCSDAYYDLARANILVHGGIGFTWEHPAHLYYRRAKSDQALFGMPAEHRERMLALQGV